MSFWLIQRGKFRSLDTATEFFGSGDDHLIDGDYMGSAEFEWGAIPKAFRRIMGNYYDYSMHVTDVSTIRGVPLCLFCRDEYYDEILAELKRYIAAPYSLKEWSNLQYHFMDTADKHRLKTNFWWCIDVTGVSQYARNHTGDWIAFIGATDRQKAMQYVLDRSFNEWWLSKPVSEREQMVRDAYR